MSKKKYTVLIVGFILLASVIIYLIGGLWLNVFEFKALYKGVGLILIAAIGLTSFCLINWYFSDYWF